MRRNHHPLLRAALLAGLALLTAGAMIQPAHAARSDNLSPDHWSTRLVVPGQRLVLPYVFNGWFGQLPTGAVYLRNDLQSSFTRLPLVAVPGSGGYGAAALVAHTAPSTQDRSVWRSVLPWLAALVAAGLTVALEVWLWRRHRHGLGATRPRPAH